MEQGKYVLVLGTRGDYNSAKNAYDFDIYRIAGISDDKEVLKRKKDKLMASQKGKPSNERLLMKIAPSKNYPEYVDYFLVGQHIEEIESDIEYEYRNEQPAARPAAKSAFRDFRNKVKDAAKILAVDIGDFDLTFKAEEYVSMSVRASIWTMYARGTIAGVEVQGEASISESRL